MSLTARLDTARAALAALRDLDGGHATVDSVARDARLWRFAVAFEALRSASRQLLVERYGPSQRTPDGIIRALRDLGVLDPGAATRLHAAASFAAGQVEIVARDGPHDAAATIDSHVEALDDLLAALETVAT
ncbi:MAG: hypothetical protein RID91_05700 [Azospirillaceae bacterium]